LRGSLDQIEDLSSVSPVDLDITPIPLVISGLSVQFFTNGGVTPERRSVEATPGAGHLYAVFMARPAIQRRLNAAVIILPQWPILMTWIIALLTLGLFVYLVYALIKPEKF
jgi:K+-transporting ATPase KdpF subunit